MTARGMNPDLFILSRADQEATEKKLVRAGANKVVMPYRLGGLRMVHTILRPAVTDFFDFAMQDKNIELKMEELKVLEKSQAQWGAFDGFGDSAGNERHYCGDSRQTGQYEFQPVFQGCHGGRHHTDRIGSHR